MALAEKLGPFGFRLRVMLGSCGSLLKFWLDSLQEIFYIINVINIKNRWVRGRSPFPLRTVTRDESQSESAITGSVTIDRFRSTIFRVKICRGTTDFYTSFSSFRTVKCSGVRNLCVFRHRLGYDHKHVTARRIIGFSVPKNLMRHASKNP